MTVTRRPNVISHATAGDTSAGRFYVKSLLWNGATAAGDDLEIKNSAGVVMLKIKAGSELSRQIIEPFGCSHVNGIETDVIDAGTVEYILG